VSFEQSQQPLSQGTWTELCILLSGAHFCAFVLGYKKKKKNEGVCENEWAE
jgi:hypothetical protein